nr:unnamed protein product [Spirometra erinaceieuropaei]
MAVLAQAMAVPGCARRQHRNWFGGNDAANKLLRAVQQLFNEKAPDSDAIPDEIYRHGYHQLMDQPATPFQEMGRRGQLPQDLKNATIPHTGVLEQTGILSIQAMLRQLQLRRDDHLVRMKDVCLPKELFDGDVATGSRRLGSPKRRYESTMKKSLKRLHINPETWEDLV